LNDFSVQTKQKRTQNQSYKTHPHLPETEATVMLFTFENKNKNFHLPNTNCINDNRLLPPY